MAQGTINKLVHLSAQTEIPTANLATSHNFRGFGYIRSDGVPGDVYFEAGDLTNCRFADVSKGDVVQFQPDSNLEHRAKAVTVLQWSENR